VVDAVNHDIHDYAGKDTITTSHREIRLTLATEADHCLTFFTAYPFCQNLIFQQDLYGEEVQVGVTDERVGKDRMLGKERSLVEMPPSCSQLAE
jgi:hypothetical protein